MKKYTVSANFTVPCWTVVEAESEDEAVAIAAERITGGTMGDARYPVDEHWNFDTDGLATAVQISD